MILKRKFPLLVIFLCFLYFFEKTDFVKSLVGTYKVTEDKRIERLYGFCGGESIGYLKHVKKKLKIESNPKIINYNHTPQNLWAIYNSNTSNQPNKNLFILLNYPGKKINLELEKTYGNLFEIKDIYFYSTIANKIETLFVSNPSFNSLEIEFYELNKNNFFSKIKKKKIKKLNEKGYFKIDIDLSYFNIGQNRIFVKFDKDDISRAKITLQNKFVVSNYKVIDQFNNCYVLEND